MNQPITYQAADLCPNCQHPRHLPGTDCQASVHHGRNFHACLCLARPGAALACPPQMTCQGGTLGYSDIWYLQHGHRLVTEDGAISGEVLRPEPTRTVPVPVPPADQTALLGVLPDPADRAAVLREAATRLWHQTNGLTEYGRGARWAIGELRRLAAEAQPAETLCRCGHGRDRHAPDVYGTGTCADCPGDEERSWRHPYTPTERPAVGEQPTVGEQPAVSAETHAPETEEQIVRAHVLALHQIGEQLTGIESWFWEHLANVRDAGQQQPAVPAETHTTETPATE